MGALLLAALLAACQDDGGQGTWGSGKVQVLEGANPGDRFGAALALLGDVDGDGYPDLAVSAPDSALGGPNAGAVYVYRGNGQGVDPKPAAILVGGSGDHFGQSLFAPGDLSGDGRPDLLVGSAGHSLEGRPDSGAAYLFLGNAEALRNSQESERRASISAEIIIDEDPSAAGGVASRGFGWKVAAVGDLNGDGTTDIAVGAPQSAVGGQAQAGAVFIFYNRVQLAYPAARLSSSQAGTVLRGTGAGDNFGSALAAGGDVNGVDETQTEFGNDLIVGAAGAAKAYLFFGGPARMVGKSSAADADVVLSAEAGDVGFGGEVSGAGDINGDGFDDVAVAAPGAGSGAVYVYFGKRQSGPLALDRLRIGGEQAGDLFGASIWGGGSKSSLLRNGLFAGAPGSHFLGAASGSAYFLDPSASGAHGASGLWQLPAQQMSKILRNPKSYPGNREEMGRAIRGGLDFNGDGRGDLVVGAPGAYGSGPNSGAVYLFY